MRGTYHDHHPQKTLAQRLGEERHRDSTTRMRLIEAALTGVCADPSLEGRDCARLAIQVTDAVLAILAEECQAEDERLSATKPASPVLAVSTKQQQG